MRWPQREAIFDDVRRDKQRVSSQHLESCSAQPICRVPNSCTCPGCQDRYKFAAWMEFAIRVVLVGLAAATRVMVPTIQYVQAADWHQYNYPSANPETVSLGRLIWYVVVGYVIFAILSAIATARSPNQAPPRVNAAEATILYNSEVDDSGDGNGRVDHTVVPLSGGTTQGGSRNSSAGLPYGAEGQYESHNDSNNFRPLAGCEGTSFHHPVRQHHHYHHRKSPIRAWEQWETQIKFFQAVSLSFLASTVITCALKNLVGRPRPDFLAVCQPVYFDRIKPDFDSLGGVPECGAPMSFRLIDSRRSFPSGHASTAASIFGVGALLVYCRLLQPNYVGAATRIVGGLAGFAPAVYIGLTRIADYRHHWSDVVSGMVLGSSCALLAYHAYYPSQLCCISWCSSACYDDEEGTNAVVLPKSSRRLALYESADLCPHGCRSATPPTQIPESSLV